MTSIFHAYSIKIYNCQISRTLLCCGKSYKYSSAVTTACDCTWSLEALSISAARDWALVCVANRVLASYRLRLRIWPLSSSFCSLSFWFSWNTESGWEAEERDVGWEWDKYLDHTSVSGVMMIYSYKKKKKKWPLLKPHSTHTEKILHLIQQQTAHLFWQHLQDITWVISVTEQTAPLLCLVCYESSMIKLPLSADMRSVCFSLVLSWTISEGTAALTPMQFTLLHCD